MLTPATLGQADYSLVSIAWVDVGIGNNTVGSIDVDFIPEVIAPPVPSAPPQPSPSRSATSGGGGSAGPGVRWNQQTPEPLRKFRLPPLEEREETDDEEEQAEEEELPGLPRELRVRIGDKPAPLRRRRRSPAKWVASEPIPFEEFVRLIAAPAPEAAPLTALTPTPAPTFTVVLAPPREPILLPVLFGAFFVAGLVYLWTQRRRFSRS